MTKLGKIFILLILTLFYKEKGFSQNNKCDCMKDLEYLDSKVRKNPAYKNNTNSYKQKFEKLTIDADKAKTIHECYLILNSLLLSLNDNHSRVYGLDNGATVEIKNDPLKLSQFKESTIYNAYPFVEKDLDSLKIILKQKKLTDIEGIYSLKENLTIGVFKDDTYNKFNAVVFNTNNDVWQKGEIIYTLLPFGDNKLLNIGGSFNSKKLISYTERIDNGFFHYMGFKKDTAIINYATKLKKDDTYYSEELTSNITYIRVGSFTGRYPLLKDAENFYKTLEATLNKSNLILDLRNNSGGGDRNSNILFKILKTYAKKNNIYVLINHRSASNAEQFAYKLKEIGNCKIFGQQSNGTVSYETPDKTYELPSGHFVATISSKTHSKYLEIESKGVAPDVELDLNFEWVEQTIKLIEEKN